MSRSSHPGHWHRRIPERGAGYRHGGRFQGAVWRLRESIELMRQLWTEGRVTFEGDYFQTERATIYDRPDELIPIYVAAAGPHRSAARRAGG
ncbi:MAG: hypothetical protein CM1200mP41_28590 [Gammaproteobacteria bacterium]|nr:MAG: hypothetical protein CM1200mP41_28590 [Gammaproteobacteria bacterium]